MSNERMSEQAWIVGSYHDHLEEVETWKAEHETAKAVSSFEEELAGITNLNRSVAGFYRTSLGLKLLKQPHRWKLGRKLFSDVFKAAEETNTHYASVLQEIEADHFEVMGKDAFGESWKDIQALSQHFRRYWPLSSINASDMRQAIEDVKNKRFRCASDFLNEIEASSN